MTTALKRHWTYSLRTLFIVITAAGVSIGWATWNVKWISQRRAFGGRNSGNHFLLLMTVHDPAQKPSLILSWFGEKPVYSLRLTFPTKGIAGHPLNGDEI